MDHQLVPGPQAAETRMEGFTGAHAACEQQAHRFLRQQQQQHSEVPPLNALDLEQLFQEGDDKTWDMADWNWDPYQMCAEPKSTPACTGCNALKRRRGTLAPGAGDQQSAAVPDAALAHQSHCQQQPQQGQPQQGQQQHVRPYPHIGAIGMQPLASAVPIHNELPWLSEQDTHLASILPPAPAGMATDFAAPSSLTGLNGMNGLATAQQSWGGAVGSGPDPAFVLSNGAAAAQASAQPQSAMQQQLSFLPPQQQAALMQQITGDTAAQLPMAFSAATPQLPMVQACHANGLRPHDMHALQRQVSMNASMVPGAVEHSSSHDSEDESTRGAVRLVTRAAGDQGDDEDKMTCQVPGCGKDLTGLKDYHQRYRICDVHIRLPQVLKDGRLQRFCQQCGRFHDLSAFDGNRKSCREQLQKHNARRRRRAQNEQEAAAAAAAAAAAPPGAQGPAAAEAGSGGGEDKGDISRLLQTLLSNPQQLHALRVLLGIQTHPALPQPRPVPAEHVPSPGEDDHVAAAAGDKAAAGGAAGPEEAASYSVAREVSAGAGVHGAGFEGEHRLLRLSVKLFNVTPADLPADLKDQLTGWMAQAPAGMEGYIRPGCVLLSLHALVSNSCYADAKKHGMARLLERVLGPRAAPFWRAGVMLIQLLDSVAVVSQGQLLSVTSYGRAETQRQRLPRLERVSPVCLVGGATVEFVLHGQHLHDDAVGVAVKSRGSYVKAATQRVLDASGARALRVCVQVPAGCRTLWVEATSGAFVSRALPVLVVDDAQLAREVRQMEQLSKDLLSSRQASALLLDIGIVLQHLAGAPAFPGLAHAAIAQKARRVLEFACDMGWAAVVGRALSLVAAAPCECGAAVVAALQPGATAGGLTPLHRAVRGGSPALVQALLHWGREVGCDWTLARGPLGLTPLHLAALLDDDGVIALAVMDECEGGEGAFTQAATDDGVTPFHLAFQMGHYSVDRVLSCLHKEIKQVTEQELPGLAACLKKELPGVWRELVKQEPGTKLNRHQSDHVEPCQSCHSTIPPLLLSIKASCASCGERQPCLAGDGSPKAAAAAAAGGLGDAQQQGQQAQQGRQAGALEQPVVKRQRLEPTAAALQPQQAHKPHRAASKPSTIDFWPCTAGQAPAPAGKNSMMAQARESLSRLACMHMSGKVLSLTALCQTCHANRVLSVA